MAARVALVAAMLIALGPAVASLLVGYFHLDDQARTHAVISSQQVARHIYGNPGLWRFEQHRLEEVLVRSNPFGQHMRQQIFLPDGQRVIATGPEPAFPVIMRRAAILSRGEKVAELEVSMTFRPTLIVTGVIALLGLTLATGGLIVVTMLPLRTIRKATIQIKSTQSELDLSRNALEQSRDLVFIAEFGGQILYGNASFKRIARRGPRQTVPTTLAEFVEPLREIDVAGMPEQLAQGEAWRGRYAYVDHDGDPRQAEAVCSPVQDAGARVTHFIYVERDITDQMRMEEQLRDAQRMESLGQLAGGIAHDFNNILSPIMGYADLLLKKAPAGTTESDQLQIIALSARRARDLVSRILLFGRRGEHRRIPWLMSETMAEVVPLLSASLPSNITVVVHQDPTRELPIVSADPAQMSQAVMNLCVNAAKAMPNGGDIQVSLTEVELDGLRCLNGPELSGPHLSVVVEDSGIGMDAQTLRRAFEPFFTTREPGDGSGLGLSTVYATVVQHEGGIVVSSNPGQGSRFEAYLPVLQGELAAPAQKSAPATAGRGTILVVDDEPLILKFAGSVLGELGYRIVKETDSVRALDLFRDDPFRFNLLITDRTMPGLSGEDLIREVRALRADLPIILCSGFADSLDTDQLRALGANRLAAKPIGADELGNMVNTVLAEHREAQRATG